MTSVKCLASPRWCSSVWMDPPAQTALPTPAMMDGSSFPAGIDLEPQSHEVVPIPFIDRIVRVRPIELHDQHAWGGPLER